MIIKRLRVEEGFFNQLDLQFTQGLNVLIGGRGVGKTSVIELLRFGLGASSVSEAAHNESISHAISVLRSIGQVVIDIEINGKPITISRSVQEAEPRSAFPFQPPIIFSQKEIEAIGLNAEGKLSLIDSFIPDLKEKESQIKLLSSEVKSLAASLVQNKIEFDEAQNKTLKYEELVAKEKELIALQNSYQTQDVTIKSTQNGLDLIQGKVSVLAVDEQNLLSLKNYFDEKKARIQSLIQVISPITMNTDSGKVIVADAIRQNLNNNNILLKIISETEVISKNIDEGYKAIQAERFSLDEDARVYRNEVEKFNQGAGAVLGELGRIREELARIRNLQVICSDKQNKLRQIYDECQSKLAAIAKLRNSIFQARHGVCEKLNSALYPSVNSAVRHMSRLDSYEEHLKLTLKGSGLKYNDMAEKIVSRVSPEFMLYYVYTSNFEEFSKATGLPIDRAARLLTYLSDTNIGDLLTATISDEVDFRLLDGQGYKVIEELSIGQRCTVILSVILENKNRVLVIDQPEDHLDNEFIATILIKALSERTQTAQTIVSSHNANIPVLGKASTVINLESNGRNGFIKYFGEVDNPDIKRVIESIMEGGKEAFSSRAVFYSQC